MNSNGELGSATTVGDERASTRVIEALATARGIVPTELDPPLYRVLDPTALDRLFDADPEADLQVTFEHDDRAVEVRPDRVSIVDPDRDATEGADHDGSCCE
ncbi:HalOD1 output domain-containing protein [Halosolutus gelatinilyticus]|uniref:HalOD1 output domain-containing protein n=1 Tax=Halosolutus gelatinilyticus TaxID=2931975 RepID=UPI001FF20D4D|nr:HalOD1 output domain-containing protein [Halosolutus gelatinilyticus]